MFKDVAPSEADRLGSMWNYWGKDSSESEGEACAAEDELHPDMIV